MTEWHYILIKIRQ